MNLRTNAALAAAASLEKLRQSNALRSALVGFDGFIDAIIDAVDRRQDMTQGGYTKIRTITAFAARAGAAAGKSANIELVIKEERFGGNGPLLAGAVGRLGMPTTYIGAVGMPEAYRTLHPIFAEFAGRCREVIPIAPPALTDALEFDDGKLMLGKPANVQLVTWDMLVRTLTLPVLRGLFSQASLIGVINWVQMGGVEGIWRGLCADVFPHLDKRNERRIFIDLADPAKRTDDDVRLAMGILREMNSFIPLTLGLNLSEAERVASVVGIDLLKGLTPTPRSSYGPTIQKAAAAVREKLAISCVVIHPREGAAAADAETSAWFDGPFTATPKLSTGAGDHFNGGFAFAQVHGLPLHQCLAVGCAVSGAYVRDALSPNLDRLIGFLRALPGPEPVPGGETL